MQTVNFTPQYSANPSFGMLKIKKPEGIEYIIKDSPLALKKLGIIKEELSKHKLWDLTVDEDGYKLFNARTKKIYSIPVNPKKVLKDADNPRLFIRTFCPSAKRKNLISFPVYFNTVEEVKATYRNIVHATGIDKMILILKELEKNHY